MTQIQWDQTGSRTYETAVDRGVLYTPNGAAVPWNGLISVHEKTDGWSTNPVYFDGIKIGDSVSPGDFAATITAYTYPDEFLQMQGTYFVGNGVYVANQEPVRFGLSYRTKIGNDVDGVDLGYKIHVLYNLIATPSERNNRTGDTSAIEFAWDISTVPVEVAGYRATSHVIFDTRYMEALFVKDIEDVLYGTALNAASLPSLSTLVSFSNGWVIIRITEYSDGTWSAEGPDDLITMLDATTFQIIQATAIYLDVNTYTISNTSH